MIEVSHHEPGSPTINDQDRTIPNQCIIFGFINRHQEAFLIFIYVANIILTGVVGSVSLFATSKAPTIVFNEAYEENDSMRVIGSFWIAIGIVSFMGIFRPIKFCPILVVQIVYKGLFLIVEVIPKLARKEKIPIGVSIFFLVWVVLLPLVVPWKHLWSK
jgi:hypothetical protein